MRLFLLFVSLFLCFTGCTTSPTELPAQSPRDIIMQNYFRLLDSIAIRDTLREDYLLLKAYYKNNTPYLEEHYAELRSNLRRHSDRPPFQRCEDPQALQQLNYDEAYRFSFSAAFYDTLIDITIGEKEKEFTIDVVVSAINRTGNKCVVVERCSKQIRQWMWERVKQEIYYCDFWGMREGNDIEGLDGWSLYVYGYKKDYQTKYRLKGIGRWSPRKTALAELYKTVLNFSELKTKVVARVIDY